RTCPTPPTPTTGPASPARRASGSSTSARSSPVARAPRPAGPSRPPATPASTSEQTVTVGARDATRPGPLPVAPAGPTRRGQAGDPAARPDRRPTVVTLCGPTPVGHHRADDHQVLSAPPRADTR